MSLILDYDYIPETEISPEVRDDVEMFFKKLHSETRSSTRSNSPIWPTA